MSMYEKSINRRKRKNEKLDWLCGFKASSNAGAEFHPRLLASMPSAFENTLDNLYLLFHFRRNGKVRGGAITALRYPC